MARKIRVGDRVRVPFGLSHKEGIVRRVDTTSKWTSVLVEIYLTNVDEPFVSRWDGTEIELLDAA